MCEKGHDLYNRASISSGERLVIIVLAQRVGPWPQGTVLYMIFQFESFQGYLSFLKNSVMALKESGKHYSYIQNIRDFAKISVTYNIIMHIYKDDLKCPLIKNY